MRYYQCKCGKLTSNSSMGVARCRVCPDCNTTLAEDPGSHLDPEPHQFVIRARKHEGEELQIWRECSVCFERKEIDSQKKQDVEAMMIDDFTTIEGTIK